MATFTNRATLTGNGSAAGYNITNGEMTDVLTAANAGSV